MNYSTTGLAYLTLSVTLGYFIYRLFQYWRKEKDIISKLWLYTNILFLLFALSKVIVGLFFVENINFLKITVYLGAFFQGFALASMAYFVIYIKFYPRISPWLGFIPIFLLGIFNTILTSITPINPFIEPSGAINWGIPATSFSITIPRVFLYSIIFIPTIIILLQQFKGAKDIFTKRKIFGIILFLFFIIILISFDFVFTPILKLDPIWRDIGFAISSIILLITLILTQKSSSISLEKTKI